MRNKAKIKGDGNVVVQDSENANINSRTEPELSNKANYQLIGIILTVVSIIIAVIIGWKQIAEFLGI
jgi:hypothetical protein